MGDTNRDGGRRRLVAATLDCLAERGYHRSSLRAIAEYGDVTAGLVRHHFDGKAGLMVESYRHFTRCAWSTYIAAADRAGADPVKRIEAFARSMFCLHPESDRRQLKIWVSFLELVMVDPRVEEIRRENQEHVLNELSNDIRAIWIGRDESIADDDVRKLAMGVEAVINGLWLECSLNPSRMTPDEALDIGLSLIGARLGVSFSERPRPA